jgi:hypothetical protein
MGSRNRGGVKGSVGFKGGTVSVVPRSAKMCGFESLEYGANEIPMTPKCYNNPIKSMESNII